MTLSMVPRSKPCWLGARRLVQECPSIGSSHGNNMCPWNKVFSGLVTLRKLCNHPDLVTGEYNTITIEERVDGDGDGEDFIKVEIPKEKKDQSALVGVYL